MRYTFRYRNSGKHKPHTAETVKDNLLCAGITCFYRDNCDNGYSCGKLYTGMPVVSILLGSLDTIMIFLLLSIFKRAFGTGKDKK